ncbi:MAG: nucleoside deaminase [Chitinophagales bacterium]|nr:nucleoside deaminase [Chitinophagales bacterium]
MILTDEFFMREAIKQARYASQEGEVPIGAVITYQDRIIAKAYNQVERLKDVTAHAEMLVITSATNNLGSKYLQDCSIYITLEPCVMCVGAIRLARFKKIVFGTHDNRHILPDRWESLLPNVEIKSPVLESECKKLLDDFFLTKRNLKA